MRLAALLVTLAFAALAWAGDATDLPETLGVSPWHEAGWTGRGVKVAILDSGFRGYRDQLGRGLPRSLTARSFRADSDLDARDSLHGVLCAELVHRIAPDAALLLANWDSDRPETFLRAVRWAREQGAAVLSCSVVVPGWGDGRGGGPVNLALADLLGDGSSRSDPAMFAAAGNLALRHWAGKFRGGGSRHEWEPGKTDNRLAPWSTDTICIDLCATNGSTYRVRVADAAGRSVHRVNYLTTGVGGISARFTPDAGETYQFRVERVSGADGRFRVTVLGADIQFHAREGSVAFPAENTRVIALGAVDLHGRRLACSGCDASGGKPDLVARVPVATPLRVEPFGGTSAAAPQAAGIAALVRGRYPDWSADRVQMFLRDVARDVGEPGVRGEAGRGLIRLPRP